MWVALGTALITLAGSIITLLITNRHNRIITAQQHKADTERALREGQERAQVRREEREQQWRDHIRDEGVSALKGVLDSAYRLDNTDWLDRHEAVTNLDAAVCIARLYFPSEVMGNAEYGLKHARSLTAETWNDGEAYSCHDRLLREHFAGFARAAQRYLASSD